MTYHNSPVTLADNLIALLERMKHFRSEIEDALAYTEGTHTFDDIVQMVISGRLSFWALDNSFLVTEIINYPRTKHFNIFLAGGHLQEILDTQGSLLNMARQAGCSKLTLGGRRGWSKPLGKQGWHLCYTVLALDVETVDGQGRERNH